MLGGLDHYHKRKRIHEKHEPYPHPDKFKRAVDNLIYFIGIIGPLMTLPQIVEIWIYNRAAGVSAMTWGALAFVSAFWVLYGLLHRDKPIIITYSLWVFFDVLIVIGVMVV